jgi:hypothetical protein
MTENDLCSNFDSFLINSLVVQLLLEVGHITQCLAISTIPRSVVLKPGVATHLCVADIFQGVAKKYLIFCLSVNAVI